MVMHYRGAGTGVDPSTIQQLDIPQMEELPPLDLGPSAAGRRIGGALRASSRRRGRAAAPLPGLGAAAGTAAGWQPAQRLSRRRGGPELAGRLSMAARVAAVSALPRELIMKLSKLYSATCHHRYWSVRNAAMLS